jgi:hypothetical protein
MKSKKPIDIKLTFMGGEGGLVPKGLIETLRISVVDGGATYRFNNTEITKEFANRQNKEGVKSRYEARLQKTFCIYPGMSQEDVLKHIQSRLKALGAKNGQQ